ncbi:TPA: hypothetical protein DCG61_01620 [Patescibacteria group bacterium]|jgi:hypothetical protein|nr:hypothetical protein [Patescibacteria group bacterium]
MKMKIKELFIKGVITSLVMTPLLMGMPTVMAASLTTLSDNMSRLEESTLSNHDIRFVSPSGVSAIGQTITVEFSGFTMGTFNVDNVDLAFSSSSSCASFATEQTLATSAASGTWGVAQSGQIITFTAPTDGAPQIPTNRCIQIQVGTNATSGGTGVNHITNGTAATAHNIIIGGTFGDTGTINVDVIPDDQVLITATVGPSITFTISDNTIGFGPLSSAAARYATGDTNGDNSPVTAHNLTAQTNATSGYVIYVFGPTLTSGADTITAIGGSNTASSAGTEQFGVRYTASGGSGTVTAPYAAAGYAYDAVSAQDQIASSTVASATTTYNAEYLANIATGTEAGLYSTTLTYTATATF